MKEWLSGLEEGKSTIALDESVSIAWLSDSMLLLNSSRGVKPKKTVVTKDNVQSPKNDAIKHAAEGECLRRVFFAPLARLAGEFMFYFLKRFRIC